MKWKLGLYRGLEGLGFPKIRGTLLVSPHTKDYSIWVSLLGFPPFWETAKMERSRPSLGTRAFGLPGSFRFRKDSGGAQDLCI